MEFSEFEDICKQENLLPVFGLRILVGLNDDGKTRIVMDRAGMIDSTHLVGILETIQFRLFREFGS